MVLLVRGPYFRGIVHMLGLVQVIRKVCDSRFSFKRVHYSSSQNKVCVPFSFYGTKCPILLLQIVPFLPKNDC